MSLSQSSAKSEGDFFNGEYIRKATESEAKCEKEVRRGHFTVWYQLDLSSQEALCEDQIRKAAKHLYRKVPSLGFCFAMRAGEMWLKRATNPEVDVKVLQSVSLEEVREHICNFKFKSQTGPLFCIRYLQDPVDLVKEAEDLEPNLPHKSHVLFGIHHGTGDGTSNMHIMGIFVSILNEIVSGNQVNNEDICGTFVTDEETQRIVKQKVKELEGNPKLQQKISEDLEFRRIHPPYLVKCFPKPNETEKTASIIEVLDTETTSKFIQRCKKEKVTINSAITAVMNMALVDILHESGVIQDSYLLQNFHIVNLRRYWQTKPTIPLGCHFGFPVAVYAETPGDVENGFWEYARILGQEMKEKVESGSVFFEIAFGLLSSSGDKHSGEPFPNTVSLEGDVVTSNMGEVTSMVTKGGDKVRITNIVRGTTITYLQYPVLINCHTFRGRITFSYEYITNVIQGQTVERMFSVFIKRIRDAAQTI